MSSMVRDTIERLHRDVERVLIAGAQLAVADPALGEDRRALEHMAAQLGDQVPAIGHLAKATGEAIAAKGAHCARAVISLATITAQVRCAQARPAAVDRSAPLEATPA